MKNNTTNRSHGARGRIAQVLAQARASLKEPSRPYTPASLDARINLDALPVSMYSSASSLTITSGAGFANTLSASNSFSALPGQSFRESNSDFKQKHDHVSGTKKIKKSSKAVDKGSNELGLLLLDINDITGTIETESNFSSKDFDNLSIIIQNLTSPLDKLSKIIRTGDVDHQVAKDVEVVAKNLSRILARIIDDNEYRKDLQLLCCRHILKLYISMLINQGNGSNNNNNISNNKNSELNFKYDTHPTITNNYSKIKEIPPSLLRTLLRTIHSMYQLRIHSTNSNSSHERRSSRDGSSTSNSTTSSILNVEEMIVQGGVELLLELMSFVWTRVADISSELSLPSSAMATQRSLDESLDSATDSVTVTAEERYSIPTNNHRPSSSTASNQSIMILLEASMYAAGIIRSYSADDVHRKRLLVLGTIENINECLNSSLTFASQQLNIHKKQLQKQQRKDKQQLESKYKDEDRDDLELSIDQSTEITRDDYNNNDNNDNNDDDSNYASYRLRVRALLTQLSHILVQQITSLRNFSLDNTGKHKILTTESLPLICRILHGFREYSELRLSCVRVTAKLSLQEPFRSQINSKSKHVIYLVEVILVEAHLCQRVMDSTDETESISWPSWSTWPLLSRAAFTLGNLTTSNDSNRALIGLQCKLLKPLISLLQVVNPLMIWMSILPLLVNIPPPSACAGSLTQLSTNDDEDSVDGEEGKAGNDAHKSDIEDEVARERDGRSGSGKSRHASEETSAASQLIKQTSIQFDDEDEGDEREAKGSGGESLDRQGSRHSLGEDNEGGGGVMEQDLVDATVKLLRLMANLCMDANIGVALSSRRESLQMLLELLTVATSSHSHEELLLNVVAACTNLSYYACNCHMSIAAKQSQEAVQKESRSRAKDRHGPILISIALRLGQCLFHDNEEIVLEAARAMGNLTRRQDVLRSLQSSMADEAFVLLLNHSNLDIVKAVTGALVNQSADPACLGSLLETTRPALALVSVLRRACFKDLVLSTLVCQVFHNMLLHGDGLDHLAEMSLRETLEELLECARDFDEDARYSSFLEVGKLVMELLNDK